jgi:hypothetical protein
MLVLVILVLSMAPCSVWAASGDDSSSTPDSTSERTGRLGIESPDPSARADLTVFQAFHGAALGAELCVLAGCNEGTAAARARALTASALAGAGVGIGTSLLATRNGILSGHAVALNSGVMWGAWYGLLTNSATAYLSSSEVQRGVGIMVAGQLAGMGLGAGLYQLLEPTQGDVALTNSFGLWGAAFTVGAFGLYNDFTHPWALSGALMASSTLAAVGGGLLANFEPMSRKRVWVINASGLLGSLAGVGIGYLVSGGTSSAPVYAGSAMLGAAAGLGMGAWLTDGWAFPGQESTGATARLNIAPSPRGGGGMVQVSGSF